MINALIVELLTKFCSWLLATSLEQIHGQQEEAATDEVIDAKLAALKTAYKDAFNGQPVSVEQRAKLNSAIADFIRGGADNGGL